MGKKRTPTTRSFDGLRELITESGQNEAVTRKADTDRKPIKNVVHKAISTTAASSDAAQSSALAEREAKIRTLQKQLYECKTQLAHDTTLLRHNTANLKFKIKEVELRNAALADTREKNSLLAKGNRILQEKLDSLAPLEQMHRLLVSENAELVRNNDRLKKRSSEITAKNKRLSDTYIRQSDELGSVKRALKSGEKKTLDQDSQIKALRSSLLSKEKEVQQQNRRADKLQSKLNDAEQRIGILESEVQQRFRDTVHVTGISVSDDLILDWMTARAGPEECGLPKDVIVLGDGPIEDYGFCSRLEDKGFTLFEYNQEACVLVVGRENWSEEKLEGLIDHCTADSLHIYSQEMLIAQMTTRENPFDTCDIETLLAFAKGHPALEYLLRSYFEWPKVIQCLPESPEYLGESIAAQSPLYLMGYRVGKTNGLNTRARRKILQNAFAGPIPEAGDQNYMAEWGFPSTRKRLWRIAHHLAYLIKTRQANGTMAAAVADWTKDLAWLRKEFYKRSNKFTWPNI